MSPCFIRATMPSGRVWVWVKPMVSNMATMPADYRAYLQLGRFRNALLLDEAKHRPTEALTTFIHRYELEPLQVERTDRADAR